MISTAYQYYLTTYAHKGVSRYDTHKRSDLKNVYNRMVAINKHSPLYKIDSSEPAQHFAIDLKESARQYRNTLLETSGSTDSTSSFVEKNAYSSNEDVLDVTYLGQDSAEIPEGVSHRLTVTQLARPQINTGDYVPSNRLDLTPGQYAFDLSIAGASYEFQFKVREDSTNLKLQEKLARLITRSAVGLRAEVLKDANGSSALKLSADQTGFSELQGHAFQISDHAVNKLSGSVSFLGINKISQHPQNASFTVDDAIHSSPSNTFTLDKKYSITLKKPTDSEQTVHVGMKRSVDTVIKNITAMTDGYNQLHDLASSHTSLSTKNRLLTDLDYLTRRFQDVLEGSGITIQEDGQLKPDEALIVQAFDDGSLETNAPHISNFRSALLRQMDQISLNPVEYMNKKLIAYSNPVRSLPSIYQSSIYSGMIFNGYI